MKDRSQGIKSSVMFTSQALLLFSMLIPAATAVQITQSTSAPTRPLGSFQVNVSQGYLSVSANRAPLVELFQEIGKQAKITFDSNIGLEKTISVNLDRVPLEDGIKQLAKNATIFYAENPKDKTRRITGVVVLAEGSAVSGQMRAPSQAEKVKEPAPQHVNTDKSSQQPEPFKFEFDPRKFAEKQKAAKQP